MSVVSMMVIRKIDRELSDAQEDCLKGIDEAKRLVAKKVIEFLDGWTPRLSYRERIEVLDYVEEEYGLCL